MHTLGLFTRCIRGVLQGEPELMQQLFGVPRITDVIRAHYSVVSSPESLVPAAGMHVRTELPLCFAVMVHSVSYISCRAWSFNSTEVHNLAP